MKRAWAVDCGDYHIHCEVVEEDKGAIKAIVSENGVEISRESITAASEASAVPYAIGILRGRLKDRIEAAIDAELERLQDPDDD